MKRFKVNKTMSAAALAVLVFAGFTGQLNAAPSYPDVDYAGPSPAPAFPPAFETFNPPVTNTAPSAETPAIAEWMRSNAPGDTMALTGERLSSFSGREAGRDTHFVLFGQGSTSEAEIQRLDGMHAALTLPADLPPGKMYFLWPKNAAGYGRPVAINRTEAWWIGPDSLEAGKILSVYGRNLDSNGSSYLYIEGYGWLNSLSANSYRADFLIPTSLGSGNYTVWAHNGLGGKYGWSKPFSLGVLNPVVWSGGTYNVKDFGAKGDGVNDDFDAISAAINAANGDQYSTVYFPAGTYAIGGRLPMKYKDRIRYMGAGMDQTVITAHTNHVQSSYGNYLIYNASDHSEYRDLTFQSNEYGGDKLFFIRGQRHVTCENVRFSQLQSPNPTEYEVIDVHHTEYVAFKNCEFILSGRLFLGGARQTVLDGCDFYGINDNNNLMSSWGGNQIAIKNCTAQSYDNSDPRDGSGWCKGRFFHSNGTWGSTRNIYFSGNTTVDMTPRYHPDLDWYEAGQVDQNSGEAFMCEVENTKWRASPTAAAATSITLPGVGESYVGHVVSIVSGAGFGQSREIIAVDAATGKMTVNEPWQVIPNPGSVASVGTYTRRMIVHDNYFDGTERGISDTPNNRNIASGGAQPYGGASDWIVAENIFHQMRQGLAIWARYKDNVDNLNNYCAMPHFFNTYINNTFLSCRDAIAVHVDKRTQGTSSILSDTSVFGDLFRGNTITNSVNSAITADTQFPEAVIGMSIFDNNRVHSKRTCVKGDDGQYNHVWIGNEFRGPGSGSGIEISSGHKPVLRENVWNGFSEKYAGATPGPVMELPQRVVTFDDTKSNTSVKVLNSGTDTLTWSATSDSAWLDITLAAGTVPNENSTGEMILEIDESAAPQTEAEAVVTVVSSDGQQQQVTVEYVADAVTPPPPDDPPAPVLTGISISGPPSVTEGGTVQYTCSASYSDGTTQTVVPDWIENSSFASINSAGTLSAANVPSDQAVTVTASYDGHTDTHTVTIIDVPVVLTGISISGPSSVDEETTAQYVCTATYSDGSMQVVSATWSENSSSAAISASGLLTAGNVAADQSVTITASFAGQTDTHLVTIKYVPPVLTGITIIGPVSVDEESSAQYICIGSYSDGTSGAVSPDWSQNSGYAGISQSGLLTTGDVTVDQHFTITASLGDLSDTHAVTLKYVPPPVVLENVSISGPDSVDENSSAQFVCTAHYSDGSSVEVVPVWSENSAYASISSAGLLSVGNIESDQVATVTAAFEGKTASKAITAWMVGNQAVFPLSGFEGKTVKADLWDSVKEEWISLGEETSPEELVIADVDTDKWYWLQIKEFDNTRGEWVQVHANWISM
jgi:hypothetical protein